ncbi:MAG: hypothetical protein K9G43_14240, partial [Rhodobacteraceae bacterium]|nr:hypothetical protein [Paracoccaceae bacterium]
MSRALTSILPHLPAEQILAALAKSPGNEVKSGKFDSPESSAALVANGFGLFLDRPADLPPLPGVPMGRVESVALEAEMRFPWSGGRHPWLDVAISTATTLVGVESKRYEPFRPAKASGFSEVYDRPVWGEAMGRYTRLMHDLVAGRVTFQALDAVQLVKHALGLAFELGSFSDVFMRGYRGHRADASDPCLPRGAIVGRGPVRVYLR